MFQPFLMTQKTLQYFSKNLKSKESQWKTDDALKFGSFMKDLFIKDLQEGSE